MSRNNKSRQGRGLRWPRVVRYRPQDAVGATLFILLLLVPLPIPADTRLLIAFDGAALGFLATVWSLMAGATDETISRRSKEYDEGKWTSLVIGVGIVAAVLVAVAAELHGAKEASPFRIALAAVTIVLSWAFTNTMFALHYAHAYYGDTKHSSKGLDFPGGGQPDYWDFVYFAFVVGTTFQTSDVRITGRHIRHTVSAHGAIAYFYTVIVLSITVNIVASVV